MKLFKKVSTWLLLLIMSSNVAFAGMLDGRKIVLDAGHGGKDPGAYYYNIKEKDINIALVKRVTNYLKYFGADIIYTRNPNNDVFVPLADRTKIANSNGAGLFVSIHNNVSVYTKGGKTYVNYKANGTEVYYSTNRVEIANKKFVEYEGNRYEYIREAKDEDGITYVYIKVDKDEVKVEKNKVKIIDGSVAYQAYESIDLAKLVVDSISSLGFANNGAKNSKYYVTGHTTMPSILIEAGYMSNQEEIKKLLDPTIQEKIAYKISKAIYKYYEEYEKSKRKAFGFIKSLEIKRSKENLLLGQAINLSLSGIDDVTKYVYKVEIKRNGTLVYQTDYSENYEINYEPQLDGIYDVNFYIKEVNSEKDFDDKIGCNFIVFKEPTIKSISLKNSKVYDNTSNSIVVNVNNGNYDGIIYNFEVYNNDNLISKASNSNGIYNFNFRNLGEYKVVVSIKDKLSDQEYSDKKEFKFIVEKKPEVSRGSNAPQNEIKLTYKRTLKRGSKGTDVVQLKIALKKLGYYNSGTTSLVYDSKTEQAVKKFKKQNKLKTNGIVDKATINKINLALSKLK